METKKYQFDEALRVRLVAHREENRLTVADLAHKLRTDVTRMSKYLHGKPDVDPRGIEARARDLLRAAARRKVETGKVFDTNVLEEFSDTVEQIRITNDLGVATGPAGIGKTEAVKSYVDDHGATVGVTVTALSGTASGVCALLFKAIDDGSYNYKCSRSEYIIDRLTGMDWPIIVDQAQLLKSSGREFLVNLWDATRCPMCLVGNPEILAAFRKNDQHFSRIGIWAKLELDKKEQAAHRLVDSLLGSGQPDELYDMATAVASRKDGGYLRALSKQLLLARDMEASEKFRAAGGDIVAAFQCAHRKLVRDYSISPQETKMPKKDQKYMTDRFGDSIPTRIVSAYDRKRDQIVRRIARRYGDAQAMLERVKAETIADLDTLEQMALADAGVKDFKAKGGNSTVTSFDGLISVQCKNRTFSAMDERAHIAKQMLDQFVAELTEGQEKDDIVQIVNSLLDTRSGEINRTAALRIARLNLKSDKFRQAKELLLDSMFAAMSKTYIYVETRETRESEPVQILLDIAKLMPRKEVKSAGPADAQEAQ